MTSPRLSLPADKRSVIGRQVKKLRVAGKIPANVFGVSVRSVPLVLERATFEKVFRKAGETTLVDLTISGEPSPRPVLITQVQTHPVTDAFLHVDLHQVDLTQTVTAPIPVRIVGEAPVVKDKGAILVTVLSEIEVEALPTDLPDHFEVDVAGLVDFGDSIHVKDVRLDRTKVKVLVGEDETVVTIQEPKKEVEEAPPVQAEGEVVPAEGEAPVEGEKEELGKSETQAEQSTERSAESKETKTKDSKQR